MMLKKSLNNSIEIIKFVLENNMNQKKWKRRR